MPELIFGRTIKSQRPEFLVENRFDPGRYRFQLVVLNDAGKASLPAEITIEVRKRF